MSADTTDQFEKLLRERHALAAQTFHRNPKIAAAAFQEIIRGLVERWPKNFSWIEPEPTSLAPGTPEKEQLLQERAARGQCLFSNREASAEHYEIFLSKGSSSTCLKRAHGKHV